MPIPRNTKLHRLEESLGGASIILSPEELAEIGSSKIKAKVECWLWSSGNKNKFSVKSRFNHSGENGIEEKSSGWF